MSLAKDYHVYLRTGNITTIICSDERPAEVVEGTDKPFDEVSYVSLPGGICVIVDALKELLGLSEEEVWDLLDKGEINAGGHLGPEHESEHIGPLGCGYNATVQINPQKLAITQSVSAEKRVHEILKRAKKRNGFLYQVHGPHKVKASTVNYIIDKTIDHTKAWNDQNGALTCDAWAAYSIALKLSEINDKVDPQMVEDFVVEVYKKLAALLAPQVPLVSIR